MNILKVPKTEEKITTNTLVTLMNSWCETNHCIPDMIEMPAENFFRMVELGMETCANKNESRNIAPSCYFHGIKVIFT